MNLDKYQSVRYVEAGRNYPHLDCYGLVLEVRRDLGLKAWPEYDGVTHQDRGVEIHARELTTLLEKCEPMPGALILVIRRGIVDHVAVVIRDGPLLCVAECNPGSNVTVQPLGRFMRKNTKLEFWK
ncbi:hypothetical protein [Serratia sp. M24T3]|uniref:hypothetical protein n=1 Tax=Serratia sp. M24T3 TaxID=932213 RepID=UPI00025BC0BB|nr:hypothetical protein [Serratia sp. M24T3]EIC82011.1 hypothetical protein SPM24T3_24084 [Serratia sp. M24T3]EIC82025.1 hypothetical protein SPM24T3_24017 [Serratia sp. M24T3]